MDNRAIRPRPEEIEQIVRLFSPDFGLHPEAMQKIVRTRAERAWAITTEPLLKAIGDLDGERECLLRRIEQQRREIGAIRSRLEGALAWIRQRRGQPGPNALIAHQNTPEQHSTSRRIG